MRKEYEALLTPWKIGNLEIKNRVVMTSMGGTSIFGWMEPNHFDKEAANFLLERARNNVGLILPGIAPIRDIMGGKWLYKGKGKFDQLRAYMKEFHKTGAKLFIQITAGMGRVMAVNDLMVKLANKPALGFLAKPLFNMDQILASASATPNRWDESVISRPLTEAQIAEIVEAFARTALLCKEAGVDGVEVHAVHEGYLLDQFATKYTNQRKDRYGGSLENRYRFPAEIVKAIKGRCGKEFPVSLRYSVVSKTKGYGKGAVPGEEYIEAGRDMKESEWAARFLQDAGYDMLNCDNGTYDAWYWAHPPIYMPENCNLEYVEHIKRFVDIPVVCAGKMTPKAASDAIEAGKLDGMGVARQFLIDPEWLTKLIEDRESDIKPCINCHNGCFNMCHYNGVPNDQELGDAIHMARCALNPRTMQTGKYHITPTSSPKKVAIIGGGIGGMETAIVLAERGHKPELYEKSGILGGVYIKAASFSFKERDRMLLDWYRKRMRDLGIPVHLETEIKDVAALDADEVVVATGAVANKPPIKGLDKAIEAKEFLDGAPVGDDVVIIGGGLTGCEIAYELLLQGKRPVIVEMKGDLVPVRGVCLANSSYLRDMFAFKKVPVHLRTTLLEVTGSGVRVRDAEGKEKEIKADSVIASMGYHSAPLAPASKHIHLVGDAHHVGNLRTVVWRAWDVAMKI